ncbi:MAG: hypothetical protein HQL31_04845, partial [Planctomycetes bacterium]|nr:hypothetical protein [Planctomycetota bacterium]
DPNNPAGSTTGTTNLKITPAELNGTPGFTLGLPEGVTILSITAEVQAYDTWHRMLYTYDALGRRVKRHQDPISGNFRKTYTYNGPKMVYDGANAFVYGEQINQVLLQVQGSTINHTIPDERGTIMAFTRNHGADLKRFRYSATGARQVLDNESFPFGYTGMFMEPIVSTNNRPLYHTHHRDYDPMTNRWDREDPAGYMDGLNLHAAYFGVNGVDPLGLEIKSFVDSNGVTRFYTDRFREMSLGAGFERMGASLLDLIPAINSVGWWGIKKGAQGYSVIADVGHDLTGLTAHGLEASSISFDMMTKSTDGHPFLKGDDLVSFLSILAAKGNKVVLRFGKKGSKVAKVIPITNPSRMLGTTSQSSLNMGERLIAIVDFNTFIAGKPTFNMGHPKATSFFFNRPGNNPTLNSFEAAAKVGFTRENILDAATRGGGRLVRVVFKLDKVDEVAIPGISRYSKVGQMPISGANQLFTGTGKTKNLLAPLDGVDEFIGNNVLFSQDDIVEVIILDAF